jgi:hypothetical protein
VCHHERMVTLATIALGLIEDALRWVVLLCRSTEAIRTENLFLRRQRALFIERGVHPRRVDDAATRVSLAVLSKLFECLSGASLWWSCSRRRCFAGIVRDGDCFGD